MKGAQVEFDLYASDGEACLVVVKFHVEPEDVLLSHRKFRLAVRKLSREVIPMIIAMSAKKRPNS
ncbi:MAG: hypothetical protein QN189_06780 [Armatimonadota bacterium]|nr:hypothetical protein [Armatimonadota bacterium]